MPTRRWRRVAPAPTPEQLREREENRKKEREARMACPPTEEEKREREERKNRYTVPTNKTVRKPHRNSRPYVVACKKGFFGVKCGGIVHLAVPASVLRFMMEAGNIKECAAESADDRKEADHG